MRVSPSDSSSDSSFLAQLAGLRSDHHAETQTSVIESAFEDYTERKDIAILLINQHVSCFGSQAPFGG
jgi:vacuolar-type H+-ATPase subunit F/Vma7